MIVWFLGTCHCMRRRAASLGKQLRGRYFSATSSVWLIFVLFQYLKHVLSVHFYLNQSDCGSSRRWRSPCLDPRIWCESISFDRLSINIKGFKKIEHVLPWNWPHVGECYLWPGACSLCLHSWVGHRSGKQWCETELSPFGARIQWSSGKIPDCLLFWSLVCLMSTTPLHGFIKWSQVRNLWHFELFSN